MTTKVEVGQIWKTSSSTDLYKVIEIIESLYYYTYSGARLITLGAGTEGTMVLGVDLHPFFHQNWILVSGPDYVVLTEYGATCTKCNTFNEYAEASPTFICYGCRP